MGEAKRRKAILGDKYGPKTRIEIDESIVDQIDDPDLLYRMAVAFLRRFLEVDSPGDDFISCVNHGNFGDNTEFYVTAWAFGGKNKAMIQETARILSEGASMIISTANEISDQHVRSPDGLWTPVENFKP